MTAVTEAPDAEVPVLLTSADIAREAGVTYRQLDFWVRRGFLQPERAWRGRKTGSGSPRVWPETELGVARTMGRLVKLGLPLETAHAIARSGQSRTEVAPGIWLEVA